MNYITFQNMLTIVVIPPKSANDTPENRMPFRALDLCMSFPTDVLSLVRLMTKRIKAVIVQMPLTATPIVLKPLIILLNSVDDGASARDITAPPGTVIVDASA